MLHQNHEVHSVKPSKKSRLGDGFTKRLRPRDGLDEKNWDSKMERIAQKTRLWTTQNSAQIFQDPNFLKDNSPPLTLYSNNEESVRDPQERRKGQYLKV